MRIKQNPVNTYKIYNTKNIDFSNYLLKETNIKDISFNGLRDTTEKGIARILVRIMESVPAQKLFEATTKKVERLNGIKPNKGEHFWKDELPTHLMVLGSTLMSGFYMIKTLQNKNLDKKKKRTLAINQGLVWGTATAMAYTFDKWLGAKTVKVQTQFRQINEPASLLLKDGSTMLKTQIEGISKAKKIFIVDSIYRLIAPVLVTPLANTIGNKVNKTNK